MSLKPGTGLGPYEVISAIGAGGMGEVYKALDTRLRREVALKVLPETFAQDPDRLARFTREAQVLASLNHPHIAQIYGLEEAPASEAGRPAVHALAMELVAGKTLDQILGTAPLHSLDVDRGIAIARQIAEALAAAHDKGIVHRDLKPSNLIVDDAGIVKVLDFGLAKADDAAAVDSDARTLTHSPTVLGHTERGVVLGTAAYMSPEQARGLPVDKRADVWAFGCVLYEMLAGCRAFGGETVSDTLAAIMRDRPDESRLSPATPPMVRWLIARCLEKDVKQRLQDLGDARLLLDEATLAVGAATPMTRSASPSRRSSRAGWWVAAISAIGLVATGVVALSHWREKSPPERSAQFSILPPEGMELGRAVQLAASPDGRYLVFSMSSGGVASLWLRPIQSLTLRPLTGTDGATLPFWSPDSRSVGFFSSGKLRTIRIEGGPPSEVCAVGNGRGATWNKDNVIVFSPAADAPLLRVDAAGGTPTPVTALDPPRENSHRMPSFLPDGRHFLFLAGGQAPSGGIAWHVKVGSLDSKNTSRVVESALGGSPVFSAGHLLFGRNRTLMALRFDPDTQQPSAAPFAASEQPVVSSSSSSAAFAASPDGLLAFVAASDPVLRLAWLDRSGKTIRTVGDSGAYAGMVLSPDESRAAVILETGPLRNREIWTVDLMSGARTKLTVDPGGEASPVWSPSGDVLYFSSARNGASNLFRKASDNSGTERLLQPSDRSQYPSDVTPDGQTLIFTQATASGTDVWALPLAGDMKPRPILQGPSAKSGGALSPDGRWLAYQSNETGRDEVYVLPFPRGGKAEPISKNGGIEPVWRGDGRELFFIASTATANSLMAAAIDDGGRLVGAPRTLFPLAPRLVAGYSHSYAASRDGTRFLTTIAEGPPVRDPLTVITNWLAVVR